MKRPSRTGKAVRLRFDPDAMPEPFSHSSRSQAANAITLSRAAFEIENVFRSGAVVQRASVPVYGDLSETGRKHLASLIHDLIVFVLVEDVGLDLRKSKFPRPTDRGRSNQVDRAKNICLFSGGVDSYAGILLAKERLRDVRGVFCAHTDQARTIHIVRKIAHSWLSKAGVAVSELRVPRIGAHGYAQLRGFLYLVSAAAWVDATGADALLVTECGPTMYQPRFSPFDSITMTTHPVVLHYSKAVIEAILRRKVRIVTPFENLTKAEVIAISPEKRGLRWTHSCVSQRFGRHDGTCYGCVIRRLAATAAGVKDVTYARNPISDESAHGGNLMSLLAYSYDLLTDYKNMQSYELENVKIYGKHDLFKRFALDNFSAIHRLLVQGHRVRPSIRQMYVDLLSRIGRRPLEMRLKRLAEGQFSPVF